MLHFTCDLCPYILTQACVFVPACSGFFSLGVLLPCSWSLASIQLNPPTCPDCRILLAIEKSVGMTNVWPTSLWTFYEAPGFFLLVRRPVLWVKWVIYWLMMSPKASMRSLSHGLPHAGHPGWARLLGSSPVGLPWHKMHRGRHWPKALYSAIDF